MNIDSSIVWVVLGFTLVIVEMLSLTFTLLFFALGCFATAVVSYIPGMDTNYTIQIVVASIVSILGLMLFRKPLQSRMLKSIQLNVDIGKEILTDHPIHPHQTARISYQGTSWQVTNLDADEIKKGDRVCIVGIDGNTLLIRKVF